MEQLCRKDDIWWLESAEKGRDQEEDQKGHEDQGTKIKSEEKAKPVARVRSTFYVTEGTCLSPELTRESLNWISKSLNS